MNHPLIRDMMRKKIESEKHKWFCDPRSGFLLVACICHFIDPQNGGSLQNDNYCFENQPFIRPTLSTPDFSKCDTYKLPRKSGLPGLRMIFASDFGPMEPKSEAKRLTTEAFQSLPGRQGMQL